MTDDRNDASNGEGTDGIGQGERPSNPPPAAPPPPSSAAAPPPLAADPRPPAPARPIPWAVIIAVVLGVILIVLVILWFTGVLDRSPRKSREEATSMNGAASGTLGPLGGGDAGRRPAEAQPLETPPPAAPQPGYAAGYPPSVGSLQGTWGPGCPESRADVVTLYSSGRAVVSRGEGTWTLNGYEMTLTIDGSPLTLRWEHISQDEARVTQAGTGDVETVRRCD